MANAPLILAPRKRLSHLVSGRQSEPERILLYGPEGVGKSTFGASIPRAVFLCAESGTKNLDIHRLPDVRAWADVMDSLAELRDEEHDFRALVVDTLDWIEPLCWQFCCQRDGKKDIEDYGYGKGYITALDQWRVLLARLEELRSRRALDIVLLAHATIRTFKNPEGEDFDRYQLKLHEKAGGLLKEWADHVLFARFETLAHVDGKTKRVRGVSTGARIVHTQRTAAYDAKTRSALPEQIPLSWEDFAAALSAGAPADADDLIVEIRRKAQELGGAPLEKCNAALTKAGRDSAALSRINDRLNALLSERGDEVTQ